jgi:DNA-binding response OmpR family regulator
MDDSEIILEAIRAVFEGVGYEIYTARNVRELDARFAEVTPDAIILDVQMPEAHGDDIGRVLREVRNLGKPIFLFSSVDDRMLEERTKQAQLDGWVSKRAGVHVLRERIDAALKVHQS